MEVRLTELRYREVINISDGTRLGSDYILPWESIARIGGDIVLIEGAAEIRRDRQPRRGIWG